MSIPVCQQTSASSRAPTVCDFADEGEGNIGEDAERVLYFRFSTHSLPILKPVIIQKPSRPYDLGLGSFVRMDLHPMSICSNPMSMDIQYGYMHQSCHQSP